jgi:hemoglobin
MPGPSDVVMTESGKRTSIYDAIGGAASVAAAVDRFYERVLADEQLAGYFDGVDLTRLRSHQRGFIAAAIGGPEVYAGRSMKEAHAALHVQPEHFDRVVVHLVDTLTELGVPAPVISEIGGRLAPLKDEIAPAVVSAVPAAAPERRRRLFWQRKLAG